MKTGEALSIPASIQLFLELCLQLLELISSALVSSHTPPGSSQWSSLRVCACIFPCTSSASISVRAAAGDQHPEQLLLSLFWQNSSLNLFLSSPVASAWDHGNGKIAVIAQAVLSAVFRELVLLSFAIQETTWHIHGSTSVLVYWQMSTLYLLQA